MSNVTRGIKSFSFKVIRIKMGKSTKLRMKQDSDYGGQPRDDYAVMNKIAPYPKKSEGNIFKITYRLAKDGDFEMTKGIEKGRCILFVQTEDRTHTFINCHVPKDLDWKRGERFNRKVEVIDKL